MTSIIVIDLLEYKKKYNRLVNAVSLDLINYNKKIPISNTTYEEPFAFKEDSLGKTTLLINEEYFDKNKEEILEIICNTLKHTNQSEFDLDSEAFITSDIINSIINNSNITKLNLTGDKLLNKEELKLLLDSHLSRISCSLDYEKYPELTYEQFPKLYIMNYPFICGNTINSFISGNVCLEVDNEITSKELERLQIVLKKYPQKEITIKCNDKEQLINILNIIESDKILIVDNGNFNKNDYLQLLNLSKNISVRIEENGEVELDKIVKKEEILERIISEVKELNLSPFEEYMYLYNTVKMYKEYKDTPNEKIGSELSRNTAHVLFNDYIVCVGYAELLEELVHKLGNPNIALATYSCAIEDDGILEGHRRCLVKLTDYKYGIDGIYTSDPTWDCVQYYDEDDTKTISIAHLDFYNHFLMIRDEVFDENIKYVGADVTDVLFGEKDFYIEPSNRGIVNRDAINCIKKLYSNMEMSRDDVLKKINTVYQSYIPGTTIFDGVRNLYSKIYQSSPEIIENLVQITAENNDINQQEDFNKYKNKFSKVLKK